MKTESDNHVFDSTLPRAQLGISHEIWEEFGRAVVQIEVFGIEEWSDRMPDG
jgi:hypothetical protein